MGKLEKMTNKVIKFFDKGKTNTELMRKYIGPTLEDETKKTCYVDYNRLWQKEVYFSRGVDENGAVSFIEDSYYRNSLLALANETEKDVEYIFENVTFKSEVHIKNITAKMTFVNCIFPNNVDLENITSITFDNCEFLMEDSFLYCSDFGLFCSDLRSLTIKNCKFPQGTASMFDKTGKMALCDIGNLSLEGINAKTSCIGACRAKLKNCYLYEDFMSITVDSIDYINSSLYGRAKLIFDNSEYNDVSNLKSATLYYNDDYLGSRESFEFCNANAERYLQMRALVSGLKDVRLKVAKIKEEKKNKLVYAIDETAIGETLGIPRKRN